MRNNFKVFLKVGLISFILMALCRQALAGIKFEDSFESGDFGFTMNGYKWKGGKDTVVSNDIARTGSFSLKYTFDAVTSGKDSFSERRFEFGENMTDLYVEYYIYYPDGSEGLGPKYHHRKDEGPNNNKFFRVWDDNDYNNFKVKYGFSTQPSSGMSQIFGEYARDGGAMGRYDEDFDRNTTELGRWVKINIHISVDKGDGAVIQLLRDGVSVVDSRVSNIPKSSVNNVLRNGYFLGWANSGFDKTTHIYIDDVRISDQPFSGKLTAAPNPPSILQL